MVVLFFFLVILFSFAFAISFKKINTTTHWSYPQWKETVLTLKKDSNGFLATEQDLVEAHKILDGS